MLWYEALIPCTACALLVRIDAIFLGPYWSWLQLIPDLAEQSESEAYRKRRKALFRRVAIPGITGFVLTTLFPATYSPLDAAVVGLLAAALLLWPLVFSHPWQEVQHPRRRVVALYALLIVVFVSSAFLGGLIGDSIRDGGGILNFVRDEGVAVLVTAVVVLFASDGFSRGSEALRESRDKGFER